MNVIRFLGVASLCDLPMPEELEPNPEPTLGFPWQLQRDSPCVSVNALSNTPER